MPNAADWLWDYPYSHTASVHTPRPTGRVTILVQRPLGIDGLAVSEKEWRERLAKLGFR